MSRPLIAVSACLAGARCRYDGRVLHDPLIQRLRPHVRLTPVCPEIEIGLGVPRDPLRLVGKRRPRLVQPASGRDLSSRMRRFCAACMRTLEGADGFLLKGRSPSCALADAKIFPSKRAPSPAARGPGLFGHAVLERFPHAAAIDERRLADARRREHFLTKLFTLARFRAVRERPSVRRLDRFHSANRLLLAAHHQQALRALDGILADAAASNVTDMTRTYGLLLAGALFAPARRPSVVRIAAHVADALRLRPKQRTKLRSLMKRYREGRAPLRPVLSLLEARAAKSRYRGQTFLTPFPGEIEP
ncbi:MAG: YbgA family protein [Planctomycetota bacterium]